MQDQLTAAMMHHLHTLTDEIGPRPAGTPAHATAARYVEQAVGGLNCDFTPWLYREPP